MGNANVNTNKMRGPDAYELLDASAGDATPSTIINSTCFWVDVAGIVKIDYKDEGGTTFTEVITCAASSYIPKERITKLYQYYTGTTDGTAEAWGSDGVTVVNAIKIYENRS